MRREEDEAHHKMIQDLVRNRLEKQTKRRKVTYRSILGQKTLKMSKNKSASAVLNTINN